MPAVRFRLSPLTTLKLRKTYRPLGTTLALGADYTTQLGVWQFRSDWEDPLLGGRLTIKGSELAVAKTWLLQLGVAEDLVTRLRLRAAVDLSSGAASARFGFRTERGSKPLSLVDGFELRRLFALDGRDGHAKVEARMTFKFPEPDFELSTERTLARKHLVGMGDVSVGVEEINLLMEY
ncbi:hypothetical protein TeGR_g6596 [Tetraparma gracilis]|uniref:Uncharacterized protein n=1 Tax=Tetraparma gracilis TaxID=2962635 RepID=A0ABQ6N836_9STRA|nr:hypothetical protein TeGR_g6596 [Tetraparma gracilis]